MHDESISPFSNPDPRNAQPDEESRLGFTPTSSNCLTSTTSLPHFPSSPAKEGAFKSAFSRLRNRTPGPGQLKRRPTGVRVADDRYDHTSTLERSPRMIRPSVTERTPLIKAGVKPDIRWSGTDNAEQQKAEIGLGRMVELGLPLIMSVLDHTCISTGLTK